MVRHTEADDDRTDDENDLSEFTPDDFDGDAFEAAVNEPMNDDDRHVVRFVATHDDGVDFDFATGIVKDFEPDRIVAEHYGIVDEVRDALAVLRDAADLRTVGKGRHGAFEVDPATGTVESVKLYETAFDISGDRTHDEVGREMLDYFGEDDDADIWEDANEADRRLLGDDGRDPVNEGPKDTEDDDTATDGGSTDEEVREAVEAAEEDDPSLLTDGGTDDDFGLSDAEKQQIDEACEAYDAGDITREEWLDAVTNRDDTDTDGDDAQPTKCAKCGHEGTDVEAVTETHEYEEVVSRGRRHPQTGEYMNKKTRTRVDAYQIPKCAACRGDVATDGGRPVDDTDGDDRLSQFYTALAMYGDVDPTGEVDVVVEDDPDVIASIIDRAHRHGFVVAETEDATGDLHPVNRRIRFVDARESEFVPPDQDDPPILTDGGVDTDQAPDSGIAVGEYDGEPTVGYDARRVLARRYD